MLRYLALLLSFAAAAAVVFAHEEDSFSCEERLANACPRTAKTDDTPSFIEATERLQCLSANAQTSLRGSCANVAILSVIDEYRSGECKDELYQNCGNEMDKLEKELMKTSILGVIRAAADVVVCVVDNFKEIWEKCTEHRRNQNDAPPPNCKDVKDAFGSKCDHNCNGKCCPKGACLFDQCASTTCKKPDQDQAIPPDCKDVKDAFGSKCDHNCNGKCCPKGACLFDQCASTTCKKRDQDQAPPPDCKDVKDAFGSKCDHNCNGKCCPKGACLFDQCASTTCKKRDQDQAPSPVVGTEPELVSM